MISDKHILLITPGFPSDENDDNCIPPLQDFARLLAKREEIKVSVITLQYPEKKFVYKWYGINVYSCGGNDSGFPKRVIVWKKAVEYFNIINDKSGVNVIHSFWLSECALIGNYLSKKFSIKHVNTMMGQELRGVNHYMHFIKLKKMKIISLSQRQAGLLKKLNYSETGVIPWGISTDFMPDHLGIEREINVIGVGSLTRLKNYSSFLNVIYLVRKVKPEIKCVIIGDGPLRDDIKNEIEKLGLEKNVELTGNIKREQVFDFIMKSEILLHTSDFESFGMVFIEALFYGLHIISKPAGIAKESEKWSICSTEKEMAKEIVRLLSEKNNYVPVKPYKMDNTINSYLDIYCRGN